MNEPRACMSGTTQTSARKRPAAGSELSPAPLEGLRGEEEQEEADEKEGDGEGAKEEKVANEGCSRRENEECVREGE